VVGLLEAVRMVPPLLWRHLGEQFGVAAPDLASLRAMYRRAPTLIEHQQQACEALGFRWLSEHQRRALVSALREELVRTDDRQRLLGFAPLAVRASLAHCARAATSHPHRRRQTSA
jgi:hypothetical protein